MYADHLAQGHGKHLIRVALAYVMPTGERQPLYVAYLANVLFRPEIDLLEFTPVERNVLVDAVESSLKTLKLRLTQVLPRHAFFFRFPYRHGSVLVS
jgi:hypothetical protein